jgi:hypothetical protein
LTAYDDAATDEEAVPSDDEYESLTVTTPVCEEVPFGTIYIVSVPSIVTLPILIPRAYL